jgi:hypothetical protein
VAVRIGVKVVTSVMSVIIVTKAGPIPWEDDQRIPACRAGRSVR